MLTRLQVVLACIFVVCYMALRIDRTSALGFPDTFRLSLWVAAMAAPILIGYLEYRKRARH
jgi:hypothetical protein